MISRSDSKISIIVSKGNKRGGRSKGRRVLIDARENGRLIRASVYPEDARKFAMRLLEMADICEDDDD